MDICLPIIAFTGTSHHIGKLFAIYEYRVIGHIAACARKPYKTSKDKKT